jgi:site-specific DNA-methyltransferase (adenine-specific)
MRSHEVILVFAKSGSKYYRKDIDGEYTSWKSHNHVSKTSTVLEHSGMNIANANDGTKRCALSVINIKRDYKRLHPTSKPVDLYKWLIERYSKEGDVVFDPTFGGGTIWEACRELNRKFIGCEMNDKFFWCSVQRLIKD